MVRMGCYSGKIYGPDAYKNGIDECCVLLPREIERDPMKVELMRQRVKRRCQKCPGVCNAAKIKEVVICGQTRKVLC